MATNKMLAALAVAVLLLTGSQSWAQTDPALKTEGAPAANAGSSETPPAHQHSAEPSSGDAESPFPHHQAGMDMPGMVMDEKGAVMNENKEELPKDCPKVSEDIRIEVRAGRKYANKFNGLMFSFDQNEWRATPCSRVTIHFVNDDKVRHQWMIHGLPKYIYPAGMFHLEVTGPGEKTGTFILPNIERTYFVHCDIAQHMEKGMKAQVKVGKGSGDLPSIPGISGQIYPDRYDQQWSVQAIVAVFGAGLLGLLSAGFGLRRITRSREV